MEAASKKFPILFRTLNTFAASEVDGVRGVIRITSKNPGPTVGISICTHGNEPSGLAVAHYLLGEYDLRTRLQKGTVYLVLNNLEAVMNYFVGAEAGSKEKYRYIDFNMNRLPSDIHKSDEYEVRRARELLPIWERFDIGLDIHSTRQESEPMIINGSELFHHSLVKGFPIANVISDIVAVQVGKPAIAFYGHGNHTQTLGIETGGHENAGSFERAKTCTVALLESVGLILNGGINTSHVYNEYKVFSSVIFPDQSYLCARYFPNYEFVRAGEVLARGDGADIVAPQDCHVLFAPKETEVPTWNSTAEEALFLAYPVREFRV